MLTRDYTQIGRRMSKRNRPSVLKREREQKRRERETKKAKKAALKRTRREGHVASESEPSSPEEIGGNPVTVDPSTEADP